MDNFVSIIVPTKKINDLIIKDLLPALQKQTFKKFELIIIADKYIEKSTFPDFIKIIILNKNTGPANKRDLGVKKAKGNIIAFIDADAYPDKNWLKNALKYFKSAKNAAVCGPGITPPKNNIKQKVSGWVWQSTLGAGGAGTYRNQLEKKRFVDDYPSFNLIVRKKDFATISGFDSHYWPGEDTKLCHDLVYKLGRKIVYDPEVIVYHHRRSIFTPHLTQIARFGLHRGYFVKILPKTSKKIGYFIPLIFLIFLLTTPMLFLIFPFLIPIYQLLIFVYLILLIITAVNIYFKEKNILISLLIIPAIISTHIIYGLMFAKGLIARQLKQ